MYEQYAHTNYISYIMMMHVFLIEKQSASQSSQLDFELTMYDSVSPV